MATATLPIRYEIENTAGGSSATLKQICCTVASEGGSDLGFPHYFSTKTTSATGVTSRRAVVSIRPKATFNSITNRIRIIPSNLNMLVKNNDCFWELVYNPTFDGTPVWTDVNSTHSSVEYSIHTDAANGAITNGITVASGFTAAAQGSFASSVSQGISFKYPLTLDANGANPKAFSLVCTSLNNTSNIYAALNWAENH